MRSATRRLEEIPERRFCLAGISEAIGLLHFRAHLKESARKCVQPPVGWKKYQRGDFASQEFQKP